MKNLKNISLIMLIAIMPNYFSLYSFNEIDMLRLSKGEKNFDKADFSNANLSNQKLSRRSFKKANFQGAILNGADISRSVLKGANLQNVEAIKTNFIGSNLQKADCSSGNFSQALFGNRTIHNWNCADIRNAIVINTNFDGANLDKVDLRNIIVNENTDFSNSSMFLVQVNRTIFDTVKSQNIFLIEKPDDRILDGLIKELRELRVENLKPKKPTNDPEKLFLNEECQICLENFQKETEIAMLPCGHTFHINCIKEWFERKFECPLCRFRTNWYKPIKLID